ncbi:acireductone synthase [Streptomyces sp. NPDC101178]|uniref:acireductone synthase n=1 Tax=Streptomyces sp. NPDC101178 TaxID=3366124 RepID=UPI00380AA4D9
MTARTEQTVVLDIEGTTSSARHVHEVLFPYARQRLAGWLEAHLSETRVHALLDEVARAAGSGSLDIRTAVRLLEQWSDEDRKEAPLKTLQGLIWAEGYARGELTGHVYSDTVDALDLWNGRGVPVHVYSSGSVLAQKQWFAHTPYGDLRGRLGHHFDTVNAGPKTAVKSYRTITEMLSVPATGILFASDSPAELEAAATAGWRTALVRRAGGTAPEAPGARRIHGDLLSVARGGTG